MLNKETMINKNAIAFKLFMKNENLSPERETNKNINKNNKRYWTGLVMTNIVIIKTKREISFIRESR